MRRLSSEATLWRKRVFPVLWFWFLSLWTPAAITSMLCGEGLLVAILTLSLFMGAFGFLIMKCLVLDLVDSVWDVGTELVVRHRDSLRTKT